MTPDSVPGSRPGSVPDARLYRGALVRSDAHGIASARLRVGADGRIASLDNARGERVGGPDARVIVPGFVNAHAHSGMAVLRGLGDGRPTLEWLQVVWAAEARMTEDDVYWSVQLALCEMIRNGVTAFADMFLWSERILDSVLEAGLRVNAAPAIFGPEGVPFEAAGGQPLAGQIDLVERLGRVYADEPLVRISYGAHAVYTCLPETLAEIARRATETGLGIQVHLSESPEEVREGIERFGETPIASAHRAGLLGPGTIIAHATKATPDDIALIAETGASVVHNPQSNLKLGSGIAPVRAMLDAGIRVALGTDGPASNDALDPLREMRLAVSLQRAAAEDPEAMSAADGLRMLTATGAEVLGFSPTTLEAGEPADFVVLDASGSAAQPFTSAAAFLGWSATGSDVTDVVVAGRPLLADRELLTIDEERVHHEVRRIAHRLR